MLVIFNFFFGFLIPEILPRFSKCTTYYILKPKNHVSVMNSFLSAPNLLFWWVGGDTCASSYLMNILLFSFAR